MQRFALASIFAGFAALAFSASSVAETPDGATPAEESACDGFKGRAYGLCVAYCEAMDCDDPAVHADEEACETVGAKFEEVAGVDVPCGQPEPVYCPYCPNNAYFVPGEDMIQCCPDGQLPSSGLCVDHGCEQR